MAWQSIHAFSPGFFRVRKKQQQFPKEEIMLVKHLLIIPALVASASVFADSVKSAGSSDLAISGQITGTYVNDNSSNVLLHNARVRFDKKLIERLSATVEVNLAEALSNRYVLVQNGSGVTTSINAEALISQMFITVDASDLSQGFVDALYVGKMQIKQGPKGQWRIEALDPFFEGDTLRQVYAVRIPVDASKILPGTKLEASIHEARQNGYDLDVVTEEMGFTISGSHQLMKDVDIFASYSDNGNSETKWSVASRLAVLGGKAGVSLALRQDENGSFGPGKTTAYSISADTEVMDGWLLVAGYDRIESDASGEGNNFRAELSTCVARDLEGSAGVAYNDVIDDTTFGVRLDYKFNNSPIEAASICR
jgi:hypothetical protein